MSTNGSDGAFPHIYGNSSANSIGSLQSVQINSSGGMSKREWFAGMALQGFLTNLSKMGENIGRLTPQFLANQSVLTADAIVKELQKSEFQLSEESKGQNGWK